MNVLFVCNQGKHRSRTAAELHNTFSSKYAGLYSESPVTATDLAWADVIAVMEYDQEKELASRFPDIYLRKRIVCLDIPDVYSYGQPQLKELLRRKIDTLLGPLVKET